MSPSKDTSIAVADEVDRSAARLEAVGFQLVPLVRPIAGVWELLAVSPRGLTLIASCREKPTLMGYTYAVPAGWPDGTVRFILVWGDGPLPTAIPLSV